MSDYSGSKGQGLRWTSRVPGLLVVASVLTVLIAGPLAANDPSAGGGVPSQTNMATVTTVNVPDGRCHEDDPCWVSKDGRK